MAINYTLLDIPLLDICEGPLIQAHLFIHFNEMLEFILYNFKFLYFFI